MRIRRSLGNNYGARRSLSYSGGNDSNYMDDGSILENYEVKVKESSRMTLDLYSLGRGSFYLRRLKSSGAI